MSGQLKETVLSIPTPYTPQNPEIKPLSYSEIRGNAVRLIGEFKELLMTIPEFAEPAAQFFVDKGLKKKDKFEKEVTLTKGQESFILKYTNIRNTEGISVSHNQETLILWVREDLGASDYNNSSINYYITANNVRREVLNNNRGAVKRAEAILRKCKKN